MKVFYLVELVELVEFVLICVWYFSVPFVCELLDICWLSVDVVEAFTAADAVATLARVAAAEVLGFVDELTEDEDEAPLAAPPPIR